MTVASPCTKVCTLAAGTCIGCGRTLDEIARWGTMRDGERRAIVRRVATFAEVSHAEDEAYREARRDHDEKAAEGDFELPLRP